MVNQEILKQWGYEHFVIYLYLCIADSDYNITDDEIDEIHEKVSKSLPEGKNYMKTIQQT